MRYENFNFESSFYNASGDARKEMVAGEMGKLIANEPEAVVLAINNAGIKMPLDSDKPSIIKTIQENLGNRRMVENLSAIVILHSEHLNFLKGLKNIGKGIGGIFKKKGGGAGGGGKSFFGKIGGFFKKGTDGSPSKFGSWFGKNKKDLGAVGGALIGAFGNKGGGGGNQGGGSVDGSTGYYGGGNQGGGNQGGGNQKKPMSMGVKLAIGGGVLLLLVGIIVVMRKRK